MSTEGGRRQHNERNHHHVCAFGFSDNKAKRNMVVLLLWGFLVGVTGVFQN